MAEKHLPPPSAPGYFQVDSFHNNFISSPGHGQAATERRHYSFSTDPDASPFANASSMEYDQTEGLGGLSVSSYDSVEDERSPIDPRIYQYHGKSKSSRAREASQFAIFSLPGSSMMYAFLARDARWLVAWKSLLELSILSCCRCPSLSGRESTSSTVSKHQLCCFGLSHSLFCLHSQPCRAIAGIPGRARNLMPQLHQAHIADRPLFVDRRLSPLRPGRCLVLF